jgi:GTP cyclohydrolase II
LAVVVGDPELSDPVLVRIHSACLTGDIFSSLKCDCGDQLRNTIKTMAQSGGGMLLYLAQEGRGIGLANKLRAYQLQAAGFDTVDANEMLGFKDDERRYEAAAEMLRQLNVRQVRLMTNNPRKLQALEKEGIEIVGRVAIMGSVNPHNESYLTTKAKRAGHLFDLALEPDAANSD